MQCSKKSPATWCRKGPADSNPAGWHMILNTTPIDNDKKTVESPICCLRNRLSLILAFSQSQNTNRNLSQEKVVFIGI